MNILAIETSVPHASLCLQSGAELLFSAEWEAERNQDAHLFPALQKALDKLGNLRLDYVLVGAGPGSYGGVRVALAAGVGIATVTGSKLVAVESWAQLAAPDCCVVADARRGGWTVRKADGSIDVLSPEELQVIPCPVISTEQPGKLSHLGLSSIVKEGATPTAQGLVETWFSMSDAQRAEAEAKPAEPIYVRPPHITAAARKPWEI